MAAIAVAKYQDFVFVVKSLLDSIGRKPFVVVVVVVVVAVGCH